MLANTNSKQVLNLFRSIATTKNSERFEEVLQQPLTTTFSQQQKLNLLLDLGIKEFNELVFSFLKTTNYPLAVEKNFSLTDNEDVLVRDDIFRILKESGVGVPEYYNKVDFKVNGRLGQYSRSRSGCFFCFFQQKIEWIWLFEQHPEKFAKAMEYEKDGYTWCQDETLADLIKPERMQGIKEEFLKRQAKAGITKKDWKDILLEEAEAEGCVSCFV